MSDRYQVVPYAGDWAIEDRLANARDNLIPDWRKHRKTGRVWKGSKDVAEMVCESMNKGTKKAPRPELSKTQRIHFANLKRRVATKPTVSVKYSVCTECGKIKGCSCGKPK